MTLRAPFRDRSAFTGDGQYRLLPFRFLPLDGRRYVVTNDVGEYVLLDREDVRALVRHEFSPSHPSYHALKSKHFICDESSLVAMDLLALKYRSRAEQISNFTGLHIFVVSLRCDHSCHYCQVSRQTEDRLNFDMRPEHADKALAVVFRSPARAIKIEFQGGEPLLNFDIIRYIVERAESLNRDHAKNLQFVIASNLSRLDDEVLRFCTEHDVFFSTSLDGPEDLHNRHRPLRGGNSYQATIAGIERVRNTLGPDRISALMTTTPESMARVDEIIDEYVRQGFSSIFLRTLSPYGFAVRTSLVRRFHIEQWIEFYKRGLRRVLDLNQSGYRMREELATIVLQKVLSPSGTGYVDLQSPSGIGIGAVVYNYDGSVYASDEGRMLAEMGDETFRLGHLDHDTFETLMTSPKLVEVLEDSLLESAPMCSDCAFLPYCGADPVFHHATLGDVVGHKVFSDFCKRQMAVSRHLIQLLEDDEPARDVLLGWV